MQGEQGEMLEIAGIGTSYRRVRCLAPRQIEQMKASLTAHGQLTALVVVKRQNRLELLDGFKRHRAAGEMGWTRLRATLMEVDERGQWAAMLNLNRATHAMSVLEEAMVLREMVTMGMTQTEIGQMLHRHRSWVSRRIGLIERLPPELVEQIRAGILAPGAGRRLLGLPAGNQLELAALANAQAGDPETPPDPRLTPRGQRLQRHLRILQAVAPRTLQMLRPAPAPDDLQILAGDLESTRSSLSRLAEALASAIVRDN
jgi:ParB/RepB/Spo0J family partition protein